MHRSSCGCGETPEHIAIINQSLGFYVARQTPTGELNQIKGWLNKIRRECEFKIGQIKHIEAERERAEKWRRNINAIAKDFRDPDHLHLDLKTRTLIVQQRLGGSYDRARAVAENAHAWAVRQNKKQRNADICLQYNNGISAAHLADQHEISRQQVYNIIKDNPENRMRK